MNSCFRACWVGVLYMPFSSTCRRREENSSKLYDLDKNHIPLWSLVFKAWYFLRSWELIFKKYNFISSAVFTGFLPFSPSITFSEETKGCQCDAYSLILLYLFNLKYCSIKTPPVISPFSLQEKHAVWNLSHCPPCSPKKPNKPHGAFFDLSPKHSLCQW